MKQLIGPLLTILVVLSLVFGMMAWISDINPREAGFEWTVRIATAIVFPASLIGLIALAARPESVPDFLSELKRKRIGRGGVVFVFDCAARDGWASVEIHYQNRFSKPANVAVAIQPSQNFTMSRNKIDSILVQFACGPAAYGIVRVPIALKGEYQGREQLFDVAEQASYRDGTGPCLRIVVGREMSKLDGSELDAAVVALARLARTGHLVGLKMQSRVKMRLPTGVAEPGSEPPPISQEEKWVLPANSVVSK